MDAFRFKRNTAWKQICHDKAKQLCLPVDDTVYIGLHGDGVPFTKSDSIEIISYNFLNDPSGQRIPFTAVSKKHICQCCKGKHTWDAILEVFRWSMLMLFAGKVSKLLPDRSEWQLSEKAKLLAAGVQLAARAILCQIRSDWPFLCTLFNVPQWNSIMMCWLCKAGGRGHPNSFTNCRRDAPWRALRYKPGEFFARLYESGQSLCPLLWLPAMCVSCIVLDWLHVMDLGVSQDVIGCFFYDLLTTPGTLHGNTQQTRLKSLWGALQTWYRQASPPSRLDHLTMEMVRRSGGKPKLRAKGAETRYLVPFAATLARKFMHVSEHFKTVAHLLIQLYILQLMVSGTMEWDYGSACEACQKFCDFYGALQDEAIAQGRDFAWQVKPKVHLMIEMICYLSHETGNPSEYWFYRDESWVGFWASASHRRGGHNNPATTTLRFLERFLALENLHES